MDCLLGIHLRASVELAAGTASAAIYHGAVGQIRGTVTGRQSHAARPNEGVNAADSLAAIVNAVNAIKPDPTVSASVKVTQLAAGGDSLNIIPGEGRFGIDLRARTNKVMEDLLHQVKRAVVLAGEANGAEVEITEAARMNAAVPHPRMEEIVSDVIAEVLGPEACQPPPVTPGGEDFHFYSTTHDRIASTMIGLGCGLKPGLHHPNMSFELSSLPEGVKLIAASTVRLFENWTA